MSIFTPAPAAGGGGSAAYDGATFTEQYSEAGMLVVEMQLTLGDDPAEVDALVMGALVASDSIDLHEIVTLNGYNMFIGNGPIFAWIVDDGYIELAISNGSFSAQECRIALTLPNGELKVSDVFEVPGSTP